MATNCNNEQQVPNTYIEPALNERLREFLDRYEADHNLTPLIAWLTGEMVMDVLEIQERTLQSMRSEGVIPFSKVGQRIFYKRTDVERLLENCYNGPKNRKEGANE